MKPRYMRFDDADEMVGHLHLLDIAAITIAVRDTDGNDYIIFNDSPEADALMEDLTKLTEALPQDAEIVV